ncbi:MAG: LysE/ArgO family amino acid transporter [Jeotgalicoccus sp.]
MLTAFLHGFILSAGLILPPGAQNVFLINQGANHKKFTHALPAVITAGLSDTLLIILSVAGVSLIILSVPALQLGMYIIGFLFLTYMAISLWFSKPDTAEAPVKLTPYKQIAYALSVSLLNPHAILDTAGIIGTNSTAYTGSALVVFTLSCIAVSWLAFIILVLFGRIIGKFDSKGKITVYINKVSAVVIFIIACVLFINIIKMI